MSATLPLLGAFMLAGSLVTALLARAAQRAPVEPPQEPAWAVQVRSPLQIQLCDRDGNPRALVTSQSCRDELLLVLIGLETEGRLALGRERARKGAS
jgi:hypothetical protein